MCRYIILTNVTYEIKTKESAHSILALAKVNACVGDRKLKERLKYSAADIGS